MSTIALTTELAEALDTFADVFSDSYLADDVGTSFTCVEVEALAGLLSAIGRDSAAKAWIDGHAVGDDGGDAHYLGGDDEGE